MYECTQWSAGFARECLRRLCELDTIARRSWPPAVAAAQSSGKWGIVPCCSAGDVSCPRLIADQLCGLPSGGCFAATALRIDGPQATSTGVSLLLSVVIQIAGAAVASSWRWAHCRMMSWRAPSGISARSESAAAPNNPCTRTVIATRSAVLGSGPCSSAMRLS